MRFKPVLLMLLVACGADNGSGVPLDQLGAKLGASSCGKIFQCCSASEIMEQFKNINPPITTEAQCETFVTGLFDAYLTPDYQASLAAGRIAYDPHAASACLSFENSLSCDDFSAMDNSAVANGCQPFITPLVDEGGGCTQDYECTTNHCVGATVQQGGPNTDGTCQALPAVGQPCTDECADGSYCAYDQTAMMEVCQPQLADGASCDYDGECQSGHCNGLDTGPGTCGAPAPVCTGT